MGDDGQECTTDHVNTAKQACLKVPTKSCLKKPLAPSRKVTVSFEGEKRALVPKSLMKCKTVEERGIRVLCEYSHDHVHMHDQKLYDEAPISGKAYGFVPNSSRSVTVSRQDADDDAISRMQLLEHTASRNNKSETVSQKMGIYDEYSYMLVSSEDQEKNTLFSVDDIATTSSGTEIVSECISSEYDEMEEHFRAIEEEINAMFANVV